MLDSLGKKYGIASAVFLLIVAALWAHLWQLAEIPRGLYVDETSVGLNAVRFVESGVDEHGQAWPIFFKAFGEYKNPLAIYAAAALFQVFGPSVFTLRLTSALFFFVFLSGLAVLAWQLFRRWPVVLVVTAAAAFLPWFFPLSRIAFEAISQLAVIVFAFACLYGAYHSPYSSRARTCLAFAAGALFGLSVYTYSTSRLLAFASLGVWGILYWRKSKTRLAAGVLGFLLLLVPYSLFSFQNPGALTARFHVIAYVSNPELTLAEKVQTFGRTYLYHFTPDFLLITGDHNLRHGTGEAGAIFASLLVLGGVGFVWALRERRHPDRKFIYFLGVGLLLAPVPAALTLLDGGIATRTLLQGLILLLFAGYGLSLLIRYHWTLVAAAAILVFESGFYLHDYFTAYPARSLIWFETYNLEGALNTALQERPSQILVSPHSHQAATNLAFYQAAVPNLVNIPVVLAAPEPALNTCLIFFTPEDEAAVNASLLSFRDLTPPDSMAKLRCY